MAALILVARFRVEGNRNSVFFSSTSALLERVPRGRGEGPGRALRFNDYGIGLLLQGDLRGAEKAFTRVTETDRACADGFVNIARVRVQEGDPDGAQDMLKKALALAPNLAKAHYFYGLTLKTQGRHDQAIEASSAPP